MNTTLRPVAVEGALLASVYVTAWWAVHAPIFALAPEMIGAAVAVDLIVSASVVHYFVGIRWAGLPVWTVSPVAIVGVVAAGTLTPDAHSVGLMAALFACVELLVGGMALVRFRTLVRGYRQARATGDNRGDALERGLEDATESRILAALVISEVRLVSLGIFGMFRSAPESEGTFSCHREVGWTGVAAVLVGLSAIEIPLVHLGLDHLFGPWASWSVTLVSLYGVLWIWGDAQALRLHPIELRSGVLELRVGLRWRASIPRGDILTIEPTSEPADIDLSLVSPNVRLRLRAPVAVVGLFGQTVNGRELTLRVDAPEDFIAALQDPGNPAST